jgi:predicted NBD/HSP70 family sugar kinase
MPFNHFDRTKNPTIPCRQNERILLQLLRTEKAASKASIARTTGLTPVAIGGLIASLLEKGLVEDVGRVKGDMGQPATLLALAPTGAYSIGVSLTRGSIDVILLNFAGETLLTRRRDRTLPNPKTLTSIVLKDIEYLLKDFSQEQLNRVAGIGVAQPYHLETSIDGISPFQAWKDFDLAKTLNEATGIPVIGGNDCTIAAMAELVYGLGREVKDFVYFAFGPALVRSLGGGIVLDGKCRIGVTGNAGEMGLLPVPASTIPTSTPSERYGLTFLVARSALVSLVSYLRFCGAEIVLHSDFLYAIDDYPDEVKLWLEDCISALEFAIYGMQASIDIPYVVINSEAEDAKIIQLIIDGLNDRLASVAQKRRPMPRVIRGVFDGKASAIGAATLPLDFYYSPNPMTQSL